LQCLFSLPCQGLKIVLSILFLILIMSKRAVKIEFTNAASNPFLCEGSHCALIMLALILFFWYCWSNFLHFNLFVHPRDPWNTMHNRSTNFSNSPMSN
jgi:hypothetical protein